MSIVTENSVDYWKPDLVREAGEVAIKTPRERMEVIMVQATEFMELQGLNLRALSWEYMVRGSLS